MPSRVRKREREVLSPVEYKRRRRDRRMGRTSTHETEIRDWAEQHGCTLRVLNEGHHWLLQGSGFVAEWWPSSANLALDRDYLRTYHAPHWADVVDKLKGHLPAQFQRSLGLNTSRTGDVDDIF